MIRYDYQKISFYLKRVFRNFPKILLLLTFIHVLFGVDHQAKTLVKIRTLKQGKKRINKYHEWVQMMALMNVFECEKCLIVDTDPDAKRPAEWVEFDQKNFTLI